MRYDFDKYIERRGTDSVKYDLNRYIFGKADVLPMWVADMDFEVADFIRDAMARRMAHPVFGYTYRPRRFFETVAAWLSRRHGWDPSPDAFSFSPGIVPALNMIVMEFTEAGDRIVVQPPVYFPFLNAVKNHGRTLVHNPLIKKEGHYSMDFVGLEEAFKAGAKMLIFCHPHNPVGRVWRQEELQQLANLCVKYQVLVISDEVHSDLLLFGHRHHPLAALGKDIADLCFTCVAPSKTFNLAGLYTSLVITTNPELRKAYERVLDAVHVGGGSLFGQVACEAAYAQGDEWLAQLLHYLEGNFSYLQDWQAREVPQLVLSPLEATYLCWLDFSFLDLEEEELKAFMIEKAGLGCNDGPMFGPGGKHHQRMNIATPRSVLRGALEQLAEALRVTYL